MPIHETKTCPRCNSPFECKVGSITICQCMDIRLSAEVVELIKTYDDCLCKRCLEKISQSDSKYNNLE